MIGCVCALVPTQATGGRTARATSQGLAHASAQNISSAQDEDSESDGGDEEVRQAWIYSLMPGHA